ncbi:MAG: hypothetical protein WA960_07560 [Tunicatimonas sp.]
MKWIYTLHAPWTDEQKTAGRPVQTAYLRPTIVNEAGEPMVGNIVEVMVVGLEYYYKDPQNLLDSDEAKRIYFEELANQDYYLLHRDVSQEDHYRMAMVDVYLKKETFTPDEFWEWIHSVLKIKGYPLDELVEGKQEDFLDMNPLLRMFSEENARKFEDKFGKDWWKKDDLDA